MSFGNELWDQVKHLEAYTESGCEHMLAMNEFMKGVSLAELEYGKALQRIARPFRADIKKNAEKNEKLQSVANRYWLLRIARCCKRGIVCVARQRLLGLCM